MDIVLLWQLVEAGACPVHPECINNLTQLRLLSALCNTKQTGIILLQVSDFQMYSVSKSVSQRG